MCLAGFNISNVPMSQSHEKIGQTAVTLLSAAKDIGMFIGIVQYIYFYYVYRYKKSSIDQQRKTLTSKVLQCSYLQ